MQNDLIAALFCPLGVVDGSRLLNFDGSATPFHFFLEQRLEPLIGVAYGTS